MEQKNILFNRRLFLALVLLILLSSTFLQVAVEAVNANFGSEYNLSANQQVTLEFRGSLPISENEVVLSITSNQNGNAKLEKRTTLEAGLSLPQGALNLQASAAIGFDLTINPASAEVTASFQYRLSATLQTALAAMTNVQLSCLQYDHEQKAFFAIDATFSSPTFTITPRRLEGQAKISIYIVALQLNAAIPAVFGQKSKVEANKNREYKFPKGISLLLNSRSSFDLTVKDRGETNPQPNRPAPFTGARAMAFMDFEATSQGTAEFDATLRYAYTESQIVAKGLKESSLRFAFYSSTNARWETLGSGANVDTSAKIVSQTTTHFSQWGVYGESSGASAASGRINFLTLISSFLLASLVAFAIML